MILFNVSLNILLIILYQLTRFKFLGSILFEIWHLQNFIPCLSKGRNFTRGDNSGKICVCCFIMMNPYMKFQDGISLSHTYIQSSRNQYAPLGHTSFNGNRKKKIKRMHSVYWKTAYTGILIYINGAQVINEIIKEKIILSIKQLYQQEKKCTDRLKYTFIALRAPRKTKVHKNEKPTRLAQLVVRPA